LVRFKVVSAVTADTVTLTVPPAPMVAVPDAAPVWFTVFPAVPVIVKIASAPEQIGLLELSVALTGKAFTVTVAVAVMDDYKYVTYVSKI
jgi:hypothetical protein